MNDTKKYFALSDIHGTRVHIEDFYEKGFDIDNPNHEIVLLGDYFDRGTENNATLQDILSMKDILGDRLILIKGNHDMFAYDALRAILLDNDLVYDQNVSMDEWLMPFWYSNGGRETFLEIFGVDYYNLNMRTLKKRFKVAAEYFNFLETLVDEYDTPHYHFSHAGFNFRGELDNETRDPLTGHNPLNKPLVIGHSPFDVAEYTCLYGFSVVRVGQSFFGQPTKPKSKSSMEPVFLIDSGYGNNITVWE